MQPSSYIAVLTAAAFLAALTPSTKTAPARIQPADSPAELYRKLGYKSVRLTKSQTSGWYFTPGVVEGKQVMFLLDTGSAINTLDPIFVITSLPALLEPLRATAKTANVLTSITNESYVCPRVSAGSVELPTVVFNFFRMDKLLHSTDQPAGTSGILGAPFLSYYSAVIDYGSDTMYLLDPAEREAGLQGEWREDDLVSEGEALTGYPGRTAVATLSVRGVRGTFACAGTTQEFAVALGLKPAPREMDWVYPEGFRKPLIYKLDGDTLTVTGQLFKTTQQRAERPTEFVSRAGTSVSVLRLKRVPKK